MAEISMESGCGTFPSSFQVLWENLHSSTKFFFFNKLTKRLVFQQVPLEKNKIKSKAEDGTDNSVV